MAASESMSAPSHVNALRERADRTRCQGAAPLAHHALAALRRVKARAAETAWNTRIPAQRQAKA